MLKGSRRMYRAPIAVVRFYPSWYCSLCRRGYREDRTDKEREKDIVFIYCSNCGSCLGCRVVS
jgi:hypothetical protein